MEQDDLLAIIAHHVRFALNRHCEVPTVPRRLGIDEKLQHKPLIRDEPHPTTHSRPPGYRIWGKSHRSLRQTATRSELTATRNSREFPPRTLGIHERRRRTVAQSPHIRSHIKPPHVLALFAPKHELPLLRQLVVLEAGGVFKKKKKSAPIARQRGTLTWASS